MSFLIVPETISRGYRWIHSNEKLRKSTKSVQQINTLSENKFSYIRYFSEKTKRGNKKADFQFRFSTFPDHRIGCDVRVIMPLHDRFQQ